jgi:hypothetical protein
MQKNPALPVSWADSHMAMDSKYVTMIRKDDDCGILLSLALILDSVFCEFFIMSWTLSCVVLSNNP